MHLVSPVHSRCPYPRTSALGQPFVHKPNRKKRVFLPVMLALSIDASEHALDYHKPSITITGQGMGPNERAQEDDDMDSVLWVLLPLPLLAPLPCPLPVPFCWPSSLMLSAQPKPPLRRPCRRRRAPGCPPPAPSLPAREAAVRAEAGAFLGAASEAAAAGT